MKISAFIIAFAISTKVFSQTVEVSTENRSLNIKEHYNVLKSDSTIKEGKYKKYSFFNKNIICEGFYKNNLKDSLWINYGYNDLVADSGYYRAGKKIGIWKAYRLNGPMQIQYDFTNNQLMYYKSNPDDKTKEYAVVDGTQKTPSILDRPPIYLEGESAFGRTIGNSIYYPQKARENHIQGKVFIGFVIDKEGHASGYRVIKSLGYGCDEEALKGVKSLTGEWLPGILNGKPVAVEYETSVSFMLGN